MSFQFERFDLTLDHSWSPLVAAWIDTEIDGQEHPRPLDGALGNLRDEDCAYYGLSQIIGNDTELVAAGSLYGPFDDVQEMTLENMVVRPGRRGQGLGSIMLRELEGVTVRSGARSLWLVPLDGPARDFYSNRGYTEVPHPSWPGETKFVKYF
jgi:GNAT superfamily N-acetyltransferase